MWPANDHKADEVSSGAEFRLCKTSRSLLKVSNIER